MRGGDGQFPACKGTCLVEYYLIDFRETLKRPSVPHQEPVPGCVAYRRHDGCGRGQNERAGTEHHQHRHGPDYVTSEQEHRQRYGHHHEDDDPCPSVRQTDYLGSAGVSGFHHPSHALDEAVVAVPLGNHVEGSQQVHRTSEDLFPGCTVHGERFSGDRGIVDAALPADDPAVGRNGLAGTHPEHITD